MAEDGCPDAQFNLANELLKKRCGIPQIACQSTKKIIKFVFICMMYYNFMFLLLRISV